MSKKGKLYFGIAIAAGWIVVLTLAAIFLLPKLKDFMPAKPATPEEVISIAMDAITGSGTTEPVFLGADGNPVGISAPKGIAAVISSKVSYTLISLEVSEDSALAVLEVLAPDTLALVRKALTDMESFDEELFLDRMEGLLEDKFETVTNTVEVELRLVEDQWCMVTNSDLSDAITGGLISRYVQLQQIIRDAFGKGDGE